MPIRSRRKESAALTTKVANPMKCPYCNAEMHHCTITGDGRSKVRWEQEGEKAALLDRLTGKGELDARYTLASFSIPADYCPACRKMIFSTEIR